MLTCNDVTINYNDNNIFSNFTANFSCNSISVIFGENGSGKTSLLRSLAKLAPISSGKIEWFNKNIIDDNLYHRNLCYISHQNSLKEEMTILENLLIWAKLRSTELLLDLVISFFELGNFLDLKVSYLSAGWQKKLSLAKLILSDSQLWLLDEPEVNLDINTINKLLSLIITKAEQGGIIIISSHNHNIYEKFRPIYIEDFREKITDNH